MEAPVDVFNTLPQSKIETILCLLPMDEAARTSILSKEWRYKWTTIPKLVFSEFELLESARTRESDIRFERNRISLRCEIFYAIHQVLLLGQDPIQEFTLSMQADEYYFEIDKIILHLSRNNTTLKKLTLDLFPGYENYKLPLCAFSLHRLTHLQLRNINVDYQPTSFNGFRYLRSLTLSLVNISTKALLHLLSNCPLLRSFDMDTKVGPAGDCTIIELLECFPVIEHLSIYVPDILPWLVLDTVPKTSLVHLKYLNLQCVADDGLRFLAVLIKCSPNLQKIQLLFGYGTEDFKNNFSILADVWLDHLIELEIFNFVDFTREMEFVKLILARSPKLKKVKLSYSCVLSHQKQEELLKTLLRVPHASPVVGIVLV